jgi:hypothetical protein
VTVLVIVVPSICNWSASNTPVTLTWSPEPSPKLIFPFAIIFPDAVKFPVTLTFFSNSIVPVPLGIILIFSFVLAEVIFQPLISRLPPSCGDVSSIISFASAVVLCMIIYLKFCKPNVI